MLKVLIVDDEKIVRLGMKMMLNWEEHGFQLLSGADNGLTALHMVDETQPDIIVTDLIMPGMGGVELIAKLKERQYAGKIVVLSNYGDYERVREAMKLGAADYLLKMTLNPDELLGLLNKLAEQLTADKQQKEQDVQNNALLKESNALRKNLFLKDLLEHGADFFHAAGKRAELHGIAIGAQHGFILYVVVRGYEQALSSGKIKDKQLLSFSIKNMLGELLGYGSAAEIVELSPRDYAVILFAESYMDGGMRQLSGRISDTLRMYLNLQISVAISEPFCGLEQLKPCFEACQAAVRLDFYLGSSANVHVLEAEFRNDRFLNGKSGASAEIQSLLDLGQFEEAVKRVERTVKLAEEDRCDPAILLQFGEWVIDSWMELAVSMSAGEEHFELSASERYRKVLRTAETCGQFRDSLIGMIKEIGAMALSSRRGGYRQEIQTVVAYMKKRLDKKITLAMIAAEVSMNESYLCRLFKSETGESIVNYLNDLRLDKAREMLKNRDCLVKEAALAVGIEDPYYFNRMFKKRYGVNPTDFKNRFS
ncbi:response regulator transcription factor [Paenibacillus contaminans]|uniref:DNA-binding response regulator n=1 Tax=Paenibacillus contaminans TaxID=450362 RepID=A0A329MMG6_9BACL|nr:response regulator [Paenibacillus contaminans]RAV21045.1 hypothetical protein DQG23_13255 [Paenibacillus contaminans]